LGFFFSAEKNGTRPPPAFKINEIRVLKIDAKENASFSLQRAIANASFSRQKFAFPAKKKLFCVFFSAGQTD
jgi:hypothetical protein